MSRLRNFFAQLALEGNIRVLAVQILVSQLGFGMFYVIWQPYILSTGLSVVDLGIVQSVINLSTAAGLIIWGIMFDRLGRKPIILAAHACRLIAIVALLISGDFLFLLAFAFFMGFSSLFMQGNPARSALITESVGDERRATAYSVLMSISMIVNTVTASVGGWLAMTSGYTPIFYVCLVGDVLGLLLMFAYLKETREPVEVDGETSGGIWEGIKGLLMPEAGVGRLYAILLVMGFGYSTGFSLFYGTLVDNYGFTELQLGILSTAFNLTWGLSSIPIGRMSDRFGRKPMLMASWAMAIISIVGFIFSSRFEMFLLFEVASGLDPSFWVPAWMALVSEKVPSNRRSTVMGKIDAAARLSGIPAPWLGGLLYSVYGFGAPLSVHLGCLMLSGFLIFTMKE